MHTKEANEEDEEAELVEFLGVSFGVVVVVFFLSFS